MYCIHSSKWLEEVDLNAAEVEEVKDPETDISLTFPHLKSQLQTSDSLTG